MARIILLALALFPFQNCTNARFNSSESNVSTIKASGGGDTFDGKLRILHHYVQNFSCEGRPQPESILVRLADNNWYLIQNERGKCAVVDLVMVTGVVYDDVLKVALYQGKTYVVPRPLQVDANEPPNLPDIKPVDGVCENVNYKCSLQAALDQSVINAVTSPVAVEVPSGDYNLSSALQFRGRTQSYDISITGVGAAPSVFDGQNSVAVIEFALFPPSTLTLALKNLIIQDGRTGGIVMHGVFTGTLVLDQCTLQGNQVAAVGGGLSARGYSLTATRTKFLNNYNAITSYFGGIFKLNEVVVANSSNHGMDIDEARIEVRNSTFVNNYSGISVGECRDCIIENSTFYNHSSDALNLWETAGVDGLIVRNSTIFDNARVTGANFKVMFKLPQSRLQVQNSVVAMSTGAPNCGKTGDYLNVEARNSLFSDGTCEATGAGNLLGNPLLGPLSDNGGFASTLLPLGGSPLIDAGDTLLCLPQDQRGLSRPVDRLGAGALCDIGAVELQ